MSANLFAQLGLAYVSYPARNSPAWLCTVLILLLHSSALNRLLCPDHLTCQQAPIAGKLLLSLDALLYKHNGFFLLCFST